MRIVASQYLTRYVLIDVLREFRGVAPAIHVRVSTMNESDAVDALLGNSEVAFGLAAPYESSPQPSLLRALRDELEPDHAAPRTGWPRDGRPA